MWAKKRETISLQPWQCFIISALFGWLKKESRFRRFNLAYVNVPRKNGKSIIAAGIGNYMFAADGEFGSEVYSGATTEKQAWEVFKPARLMVKNTPELAEAFGITVNAKSLIIEADGSKFEPVIGSPGDGASVHCGIVDEYHEHATDDLFDTLRTGMGARKQPLLLAITTAGDNLAGPCKQLQDECEKVLLGTVERDELFAIIYTIDAGDDWTSEAALWKANPNLGVSIEVDFLRTEQRNAVRDARKQGVTRTKYFNIWVGSNSAYFNHQDWLKAADESLTPEEFKGLPCIVGLDISSKKDFTARVLIFKKRIDGKDHYYVFPRLYLPEARAMLPEFQHYQAWVKRGFIQTTPAGSIDYERIQSDTIEDVTRYKAAELCYDGWNAEQMAQAVAKATRATAVEIVQQARVLSDPMKQLDALISDGRIHHDGNPVMSWMMSNVVAHEDAKGNVMPRKERDEAKIDGAAALITGMVRALVSVGGGSVYESRGMLVLG